MVPVILGLFTAAVLAGSVYYIDAETQRINDEAVAMYNELGGGEAGAQAALGVLTKEGSELGIEIVIGVGAAKGLYYIGGKAFSSAKDAYKAYQASKGFSQAALVSQKEINRANHLFGKKSLAKHKLEDVLNDFDGDQIKAYRAIEVKTQELSNSGKISDQFTTEIKLNGKNITVQGRVIDGKVNISTAYIPN